MQHCYNWHMRLVWRTIMKIPGMRSANIVKSYLTKFLQGKMSHMLRMNFLPCNQNYPYRLYNVRFSRSTFLELTCFALWTRSLRSLALLLFIQLPNGSELSVANYSHQYYWDLMVCKPWLILWLEARTKVWFLRIGIIVLVVYGRTRWDLCWRVRLPIGH